MSWTSLKMISLGSLLLFGERPLCAGGSPCVSENEANQRLERFHKNRPGPWVPRKDHRTTCEDVARLLESEDVASQLKGEHMTRSVSPWRYRIDSNINRSPAEIPMAECLCKGCILEHKETHDYNSVSVTTHIKVLYKIPCPDDPGKYLMKHEYFEVSVGCICVEPKRSS
ncbi:interleukin-17C-like [Takifugu flavidus]|uniref:Interleukin-17C n=1 Tax=Takifugu flavidus TaxID=433684 RepID=A0A5C6NL09_9TELE|nr:interleukin-17C-like [Takifugu flavidus]TWW67625.1 Interleukin-17C [Takifugu flavidus]